MAYLFDIETNGLLDVTDTMHSLCMKDPVTQERISAHDHGAEVSLEEALEKLEYADLIIGHNIIDFDIPAIAKIYPGWEPRGAILDTLVLSRLIWPDLKDRDFRFARKHKWFPKKLIGSHSLKAWGYRLGDRKGEFGETTDWQHWSPEMQSYCEQDVEVTDLLWKRIEDKKYSKRAIQLEHDFKLVLNLQEVFGFPFHLEKAHALYSTLAGRRAEIEALLQEAFPPKTIRTPFVPKANNKKLGYVKGVPTEKVKVVPFNPASRQQIGDRLKEMGWKPTEFTPAGQPVVSETVLKQLDFPEAKLLQEYLMVQKRLGQVSEGKNGWLKLERNGRIHGRVITNGAVTGRCTHSTPNVAQVPSVGVPFGHECRELFHAPPGYVVVGCDASGLELRCLGHYVARYDGGAYVEIILNGDIHWANTLALGLVPPGTERDEENDHHNWARNKVSKRFIYAFLYGAGDELLGSILEPDASPAKQKKVGAKLRKTFLDAMPALKRLVDDVKAAAKKRGYLVGLDGRHLHVRSEHSALNTLLQSAGALVMKEATVVLWRDLEARGDLVLPQYPALNPYEVDVWQAAHVHDEYQLIAREHLAHEVGEVAVGAIRQAGESFNFRCPLDGEYKIGANWAETH